MDCVFCKVVKNEIPSNKIWENDKFYAFLDINPIREGHTLIIPKEHHEKLFDMDTEDYSELFKHIKELSNELREAMGTQRVGLIVEGFLIPHAHVHLVPINEPGELNPTNAREAEDQELQKVAKKIRNSIDM